MAAAAAQMERLFGPTWTISTAYRASVVRQTCPRQRMWGHDDFGACASYREGKGHLTERGRDGGKREKSGKVKWEGEMKWEGQTCNLHNSERHLLPEIRSEIVSSRGRFHPRLSRKCPRVLCAPLYRSDLL